MCIGIPMQVSLCTDRRALCRTPLRPGAHHEVDLALIGPVAIDDWLLVFDGAAREQLSGLQAREILQVLQAIDTLPDGCNPEQVQPGFIAPRFSLHWPIPQDAEREAVA
jgi:hydrogenase assembly chaperone HypC/HupF